MTSQAYAPFVESPAVPVIIIYFPIIYDSEGSKHSLVPENVLLPGLFSESFLVIASYLSLVFINLGVLLYDVIEDRCM